MGDLLALAERCEKAARPDRELDLEIVYTLYPDIGPYQGQCIGDEPIFWHDPYRKQPCPKLTASLDAAMTLVPENHVWMLANTGIDDPRADLTRATAMVGLPDSTEGDPVSAATPALALCAAALRARHAIESGANA